MVLHGKLLLYIVQYIQLARDLSAVVYIGNQSVDLHVIMYIGPRVKCGLRTCGPDLRTSNRVKC